MCKAANRTDERVIGPPGAGPSSSYDNGTPPSSGPYVPPEVMNGIRNGLRFDLPGGGYTFDPDID